MFSILPDLSPHDPHTVWYTSSRQPFLASTTQQHDSSAADTPAQGPGPAPRRPGQAALERSALARLRADEQYMERRKHNVSNFGSTWLKPPGVAKSLFQMREERREAEEHAEAMRREQLAQQLADAEGAAAGGLDDMGVTDLDGEPMDEDGMMEGGRDLDDEIPDADADGFGFDGAEEDSDEDEENDSEAGGADDEDRPEASPAQQQQQRAIRDQLRNVRATEDRVRELMIRGQGPDSEVYGAEDDIDEEDRAQMLEEDDLVQIPVHDAEPGMDMDMDADLDDDIPEAESGGYEHTDTEAELSSSEDGSQDVSHNYGGGAPQTARFRGGLPRTLPRGSLPRSSIRSDIDLSSLLSRDGSSAAGSSPQLRRRN